MTLRACPDTLQPLRPLVEGGQEPDVGDLPIVSLLGQFPRSLEQPESRP